MNLFSNVKKILCTTSQITTFGVFKFQNILKKGILLKKEIITRKFRRKIGPDIYFKQSLEGCYMIMGDK